MTTYRFETMKCAVCGKESKQQELMSTHAFGAPDLDLRPAPAERYTVFDGIKICPHCGYCAPDISADVPAGITEELVKAVKAEALKHIGIDDPKLIAFYMRYLFNREDKRTAFFSLRKAAWWCDDKKGAKYSAMAIMLRGEAADILDKMLESSEIEVSSERDTFLLVKADLLRRSGQFDRVIAEYADTVFQNELLNRILAFEIEKAKKKDFACYTVADVPEKQKRTRKKK